MCFIEQEKNISLLWFIKKKLNKTKSRQIPKRCSLVFPKAYIFFQFILLHQTEDITSSCKPCAIAVGQGYLRCQMQDHCDITELNELVHFPGMEGLALNVVWSQTAIREAVSEKPQGVSHAKMQLALLFPALFAVLSLLRSEGGHLLGEAKVNRYSKKVKILTSSW